MPVIAIFGSFDGLHPGHEHLLQEAKTFGDVLVILAQDGVIRRLKHREPHYPFETRHEALKSRPEVWRVRASDEREGEYHCILEEMPEIVGFGYDQQELKENFLAWKEKNGYHCTTVTLSPFEPHTYKTSLLNSV